MKDAHNSFEQIYRQYLGPVSRYLARMVTPAEAEDLTQEVFAKVAKNLDSFEGRAKLSTWIYRIATNTALDRLRCRNSRGIEIPLMAEMDLNPPSEEPTVESVGGPLKQVIASEMNDCIRQQMDKLPEKYRTVMILNSLEELKNREVADILEISLETVKIRLHRGRAMLKEILEEACHFYHHPDSGALSCDRKLPEDD